MGWEEPTISELYQRNRASGWRGPVPWTSTPLQVSVFTIALRNPDWHSKKTTEAGCQRGMNTYQCWPPLQLNDTIQVHKYTKSIKKEKKQLVYKLTRVQRERETDKV